MAKSNATGATKKTLSHLCEQPPVNLKFQGLSYRVPQGRKGPKLILKNISGEFRSGQLSAILGPSGAGKTVLLNVLAGYKTIGVEGSITINDQPRNTSKFRKLSRYIMQDNLLQPMLTAQEYMMVAADLKLNRELSKIDKLTAISEILEMLRLTSAKDTLTDKLSGGERKRLSVALELLNNPSVIFLDEPISGLDVVASSQCISLLKLLAEGGRTVICSIHAPSARIFSNFDHTYFLSTGQCMFQGYCQEVLPFLSDIGLTCPSHYNPADFIVEVSSGDYGSELLEEMSTAIDNGKNINYCKQSSCGFEDVSFHIPMDSSQTSTITYTPPATMEIPAQCSTWYQFRILLFRFWLAVYRDRKYLILKLSISALLGIVQGSLYLNIGQDGSKVIFNSKFCYSCIIMLFFLSMMSVLLHFHKEVRLIKREHFNQWYGLTSYYLAMSMTTLPIHFMMTLLFVSIAYFITDQPLEFERMLKFFLICILITFASDSFGLMVSSTLDFVNAMFMGVTLLVPMLVLPIYHFGRGENMPLLINIAMHFSYFRYGIEGLIMAVYGNGRPLLPCPDEEVICPFRDPKILIKFLALGNGAFWVDLVALLAFFLVFRLVSFYLFKQRLRPNKTFTTLHAIGRMIKSNFTRRR